MSIFRPGVALPEDGFARMYMDHTCCSSSGSRVPAWPSHARGKASQAGGGQGTQDTRFAPE